MAAGSIYALDDGAPAATAEFYVDASPAWSLAASARWEWTLQTDVRGVLDRVGSVSFIARLPAEEIARVEAQVRAILANAFVETDDGTPIAFPYVAEAYLLRRDGA